MQSISSICRTIGPVSTQPMNQIQFSEENKHKKNTVIGSELRFLVASFNLFKICFRSARVGIFAGAHARVGLRRHCWKMGPA